MILTHCIDCKHNFIFHIMVDYHSHDKRLYCKICNVICKDEWNDPVNTDIIKYIEQ